MKKYVLYLLFCLPLLIAINSFGAVDPKIQWETFMSPHFEIIYDARQYQTARNYALRLELNYKLLSSYFSELPKKTIVIINDNTDLANGYATSIPYPHIMVYPVLPTSHDSISEYSDWPQELTLHEYTHILNFEPVHGFFKFLRYTMGSIITPTMLLPRWWHEGIAVEMETRFSSHGRLRSIYQEATLRALAKDNKFNLYSIADINETDLDSWPRGARPYLFGSILLSEMLNKENSIGNSNGISIGDNLLQNYSSRIPYLLNGPVNDQLGMDFQSLFAQTIEETKSKTQAQLNKIHEVPPSPYTIIAPDLLESHTPQLSPNGRFLTFVGKNKWGKSLIQIYDRHEDGRAFDLKKDLFEETPPVGNINRVAWLPDSSGFIFDQVKFIDAFSNYSDLFSYDLNTKKNKRLTTGLRLREPHVSTSGQLIAAIQLEQSNSKLVTLDRDGTQLKELYNPEPFVKLTYPLFINEETILFTERELSGIIHLKKINILTKNLETINVQNLSQIESLNQESAGISFVAQENGLQNLYFTPDQFKTNQRLTHTDTAIFDGSIDQRLNLVYSTVMTSSGTQVSSNEPISYNLKTQTPKIIPLLSSRYDNPKIRTPTTLELESEFGENLGPKETYSSFNYLRPRYWLPFAYVTSSGYGTQISTTTFDPLEKQTYTLQVGYDSFTREASVGLNYFNTMTPWPVSLSAINLHRNQLYLNTQYDAKLLDLMFSHDLRPLSENSTFWLGLNSSIVTTSHTRKRIGPKLMFIYDGTSKSTFSQIPFSGLQFTLNANQSIKTEQNSYILSGLASATYYHSHYLPERHIALLHLMAQQMKGELLTTDYSQSSNYYLTQNFSSPQFVLRGYEQGYFYLKSAQSATFEYHLPLTGYKGWGTLPIFSKKTHLNIYAEALALDGIALNYASEKYQRTFMNKYFTSYGVELKDDLTLGYYFPMTFLLGLYQRPQYSGSDKTTLFLGFQI